EIYKRIFLNPMPTLDETIEVCRQNGLLDSPHAQRFVEFIQNARRGVVRPDAGGNDEQLSASI
ncbi:MAG: hypothetical protein RJB13_334, partial [Pseudomonadota bacterium]